MEEQNQNNNQNNQNNRTDQWGMGGRRPFRGAITFLAWAAGALFIILIITQIKSWQSIAPAAATNTISVNGQGIAYAIPDIATFSVTVSEEASTVAEAQSKATADGNAVTDYLTKNGVAQADIQTSDYSINPKYEYESAGVTNVGSASQGVAVGSAVSGACPANLPCPIEPIEPVTPTNPVQVGYTVSETLSVKVRVIANAGTLLAGVGGLHIQNVSGLTFTVDNPETTQNQARALAIKDAQSQAQILAAQLGVRLVRVTGFSENSGGGVFPVYSMAAAGSNAAVPATPPEISAGQNQVISNVTITYEIE